MATRRDPYWILIKCQEKVLKRTMGRRGAPVFTNPYSTFLMLHIFSWTFSFLWPLLQLPTFSFSDKKKKAPKPVCPLVHIVRTTNRSSLPLLRELFVTRLVSPRSQVIALGLPLSLNKVKRDSVPWGGSASDKVKMGRKNGGDYLILDRLNYLDWECKRGGDASLAPRAKRKIVWGREGKKGRVLDRIIFLQHCHLCQWGPAWY